MIHRGLPPNRTARPGLISVVAAIAAISVLATPVHAQEYELFNRFSFAFEGSWAEYLAFKRVSFGGGLRFTRIDADMTTGTEIAGNFRGYFKAGTLSSRLFVRVRF